MPVRGGEIQRMTFIKAIFAKLCPNIPRIPSNTPLISEHYKFIEALPIARMGCGLVRQLSEAPQTVLDRIFGGPHLR